MYAKKSVVAIAAALALSACTQANAPTDEAPAGTNRPSTTATEEVTTPASETTTEEQATTGKFGQTHTWNDGISVTVSAPKAYKPSDSAMTGKEKNNVVFTITLVNKSGKVFDPTMFSASMQSGNTEAEQVFDSANDVGGSPQTKLLNGREAKFQIAFNVSNPKDLVMEVRPSFEHESVIFTS